MQTTLQRDHSAFQRRIHQAIQRGDFGRYEKRESSPDLVQTLDQITAATKGFKAQITDLSAKVEQMETRAARPGAGATHSNATQSGAEFSGVPAAERRAFEMFLKTGEKSYLEGLEVRAVNVAPGNDGGFAVPTWFDKRIHSVERNATPFLDMVYRSRVSSFPARHLIATGTTAHGWVGETASRAETANPKLEKVEFSPLDIYCFPFCTNWALQDASFRVDTWLAEEIALTMGFAIQAQMIAGTASTGAGIKGVLAHTVSASPDASRAFGTLQELKTGVAAALPAAATLPDFLQTVVQSLRQQYRQGASWVMNPMTIAAIRSIKDTTGRPLLVDSLISQQPSTLLGYPVVEVEDMPDIAANARPIMFGNFERGYALDEHESGTSILVDPYSNKPYVGFYTTRRLAGGVLDSNAIKIVTCKV